MKFDFNQIMDFFNKLDIKFRYAIFVGFLLFLFAIDVFSFITLQWNAIQKLDDASQELSRNIEKLKIDAQRIGTMKVGLENNRKKLEGVNNRIRQIGEVPLIMQDMSNWANQEGVKIDQLTPQTEAQKILVSNTSMKYYTLPIVYGSLQVSYVWKVF